MKSEDGDNSRLSDFDPGNEMVKTGGKARQYAEDPQKAKPLYDEGLKKAEKNKESLKKVWNDLMTLFRMFGAWIKRDYRQLPWKTICFMIAAILYLLSPVDAIPDFIPVVGLMDDASFIAFVVWSIRGDIEKFKEWEGSS